MCTVAVCSSALEGEITSSCQPLSVSICCCLLSSGCWHLPPSEKSNAVASNPSREALFDAHWQKPGSGYSCFPCVCVSKYVHVLLSGEFLYAHPNKQTNSYAWLLFRKHWPLFTSDLLPSCSLFELQCTKRNTDVMLTTCRQMIQNQAWLLTHVQNLKAY